MLALACWCASIAPLHAQPKTTGDYSSDLSVLRDAQAQALEQAKALLAETEKPDARAALESAIREMERSQSALDAAKDSPDKLPVARAAQEAAYQALLKIVPREFHVSRGRNRSQGNGDQQRNQRQLDQLDLKPEENRYETERQAAAAQTPEQREQSQLADRLKQLARRQQDLNERLRDLQTALSAAQTESERAEIQRQLKRLRDEERQMLSDVDELRQQLERSPNASSQAQARQQLDQTRSDVQRAAEELDRESPSQALAAGTRAEQSLQNLREDVRKRSSSQFSEQMRQLRNDARELARQEDDLAHALDSLQNADHKSLGDSPERERIAGEMSRQQNALTNLLAGLRGVTEQSENVEPLLSQKLYDTLRRAEQGRTDNLLQMGAELTQRGFLPQATELEQAARTNIHQLRQGVERAAESVLGNEAEALRYAQKELDDLARQAERDGAGGTNAGAANGAGSNRVARAANQNSGDQASTQPGSPGERGNSPSQNSNGSGPPQSADQNQNSSGNPSGPPGTADNPADANGGGGNAEREQLRRFAQQLGGNGGGGNENGGPITGGNFLEWSDRLRDVEQVVDSADLRNQLATVRERMGGYRAAFRENGRVPGRAVLQDQVVAPLTQVRVWLQQELARRENANSLVPLDRDPVPENYSELVRKYYEKLGSAQ